MMILSFKVIIVYIGTMKEIPFNKSLPDYKISTTISSRTLVIYTLFKVLHKPPKKEVISMRTQKIDV